MGNVTQLPVHRRGVALLASRIENGEEITVFDRAIAYQNLSRYWRKFLTSAELSLALYILDRTVGWGKTSFTAYSANIIHGTEEYAGLGMSERSYFRTVDALQIKGLISRRSRRDRTEICINLRWVPDAPTPAKKIRANT